MFATSPKAEVYASTNGGFPHGELMYARESVKRGTMTQRDYAALLEQKVARTVRLQEESGIDIYTDGAYGFDDLFSPFFEALGLKGVERDGLIRFFDNNTYYRRPVIVGRLEHVRPSIKPMVEATLKHVGDPRRLKALMPGPYTFVALSENSFYTNTQTLLADASEALGAELEAILSTGVGHVEINDPSLGWVDEKTAQELLGHYKRFVGDHAEKLWFTLPFHQPNPQAIRMLSKLGDVVVSLDLSSTTLHGGANVNDSVGWVGSATAILRGLSDTLAGLRVDLGLVDARNTLMESVEHALQIVGQALRLSPKQLYLSNNTTFDFLPESVAFEKVKLLGRLKAEAKTLG